MLPISQWDWAGIWSGLWPLLAIAGVFIGYGVIRTIWEYANPNSSTRKRDREWERLRQEWKM